MYSIKSGIAREQHGPPRIDSRADSDPFAFVEERFFIDSN